MSKFINYRVYSDYSLGYSANKIGDIITHAAIDDADTVVMSDKYNLFGSLEFSLAAVKKQKQPIVANVIRLKIDDMLSEKDDIPEVLLIAKDKAGLHNLIKLSSISYTNCDDTQTLPFITETQLLEHKQGIILLYGGQNSWAEKLILDNKLDLNDHLLVKLHETFGRYFYIEISRNNTPGEEAMEEELLRLALQYNIPIVGTSQACFPSADYHHAQDALLCITAGRYLLEEDRPKANPSSYLKKQSELCQMFGDLPEAIQNTINIAESCSAYLDEEQPLLPGYQDIRPGNTLKDELRERSVEGLKHKIKDLHYEIDEQEYFDGLEYELKIINQMNYPGYFLIVSDFIKWSKDNDIPVGPGRGSGVGCVVAWSLQITDLDPIKYKLLFERFLNPERVSMPDFDIDFCQDRRDEVIKYVTQKYGADRVAQILTFGKLQARAVLRDVGRVLQIPYVVVDKICKLVPNNPANPVTLAEAINLDSSLRDMARQDQQIDDLINISLKLEGVNRHVSTHAAGVVIADRPLTELIPTYQDQNTMMPAVQYTMKYAEAAGLVKFDFLGLKTLTVISWCCELIKRNNSAFQLDNCRFDDVETYKLLTSGRTTGVFQFESAGMKEAIKKLKPDEIEDLVALGSLYRPGPMDNIPKYINRKHGIEKAEYLHPVLEESLQSTYGIIVYQEQVMEIAQKLSGFTLGGADLLRRAMGKKIKSEMEALRSRFIEGAVERKVDKKLAEEIFELVNKFASYGFNRSHAVAYAVLSYQTAYLKANYMVEFLISSMNLEINDTDKINLFIQEAKHFDIDIVLPDINKSDSYFKVSQDGGIVYGLAALKNLGVKLIDQIVEEREHNGLYRDLMDFTTRAANILNKRAIEGLIKSGALNSIISNQAECHHNAEMIMKEAQYRLQAKNSRQQSLFGDDNAEQGRALQLQSCEDWGITQKLLMEFEAIGFYLSRHPLDKYRVKLNNLGVKLSHEVESYGTKKGHKILVAGVITSKKIRSSKRGKYAFLQISDENGLVEVSIFDEKILYAHDKDLTVGNALLFTIEVKTDDTGTRVVITHIANLDDNLGGINTRFNITINNENEYEAIKKYLKPEGGVPVQLIFNGTGGKVHINLRGQFISYDDSFMISDKEGVMIEEV